MDVNVRGGLVRFRIGNNAYTMTLIEFGSWELLFPFCCHAGSPGNRSAEWQESDETSAGTNCGRGSETNNYTMWELVFLDSRSRQRGGLIDYYYFSYTVKNVSFFDVAHDPEFRLILNIIFFSFFEWLLHIFHSIFSSFFCSHYIRSLNFIL